VPLLVLLAVAVMIWRAERRYAAVTHRVLHDYAAIAAWQYARGANSALHDEAMQAFMTVTMEHQRTGPSDQLKPAASLLVQRANRPSVVRDSARFAFTYDVSARRLETAGGQVDDATRAMLERRLERLVRTARKNDDPHWVLFDSSSELAHTIVLWTLTAPDRALRAAYGLVADPRVLRPRLTRVIREANLVPGTTTNATLDENDVAIRLTRSDGSLVFGTPQALASTAATDSAGLQQSELRTTLDLAPRLANALLVGGAPGSQLPLLGLLIALAAILAGLGVVHDRRNRELARLRSRFVANVSHELRTPLAQISMFAETLTLHRERSDAEGRQFAAIIFAEARRLTALVESVLRFSRLEAGRDSLRMERASIRQELAESVDAFAPIAQSAEASITVVAGDADADVDRAAFRQIMLNLLDNAVKHGGRGTFIDVSTVSADGELRVIVDDSGPGVPPEWRERVFHPFVRFERGNVSGAGIGLAVVRDLVAAHHGRVWIEQSPRGGARFIVAIPAVAALVTAPRRDAVSAGT